MSVFTILNLCGIMAFSVSGALKALNHKLDILGVVILGVITAIGGGLMRDVMLNVFPDIFSDNLAISVALVTALISFVVGTHIHRRKKIIVYFDAAGLAVFCALGAEGAIQHGYSSLTIMIFASVITATGGGIMRDVLVREIPFILNKEIYAILCILGASLSYVLFVYTSISFTSRVYIVILCVFIARVVAIRFKLELPKGII